jgi:hypothetical protein
MSPSRREFIRQVSILLTSLAAAHCTPSPGQNGTPPPGQDNTPRDRLRECWLSLERVEERAHTDYRGSQEMGEQLQADHRAALDGLIESGELSAATAEHMQMIYDEALYHIERSMGTCYESIPMPDYLPSARGQMMRQTDLLAEMATKGDLDPETVAQAQAALERDVAFLNLTEAERRAFYGTIRTTDGVYPYYEDLDLEISPEAAEAARFLIALLSES